MKHMTSLRLVCCYIIATLTLTACEKAVLDEDTYEAEQTETTAKTKKFTFTTKGDFKLKDYGTRAAVYLTDESNTLTDLWLFDYKDGQLVQQLHQQQSDADWGQPMMMLTYGQHHIYFVASRGAEPVVNTDQHTITFTTPRDTYWQDYSVEVKSTSNGNRAVTLDRVATRLQIIINDHIPANAATITITPSVWYYGLDYLTGDATDARQQPVALAVPEARKDTDGPLSIGIYGLSPATEWTTNVAVTATATDQSTLGTVTITNAPMQRNRQTQYSGNLFSNSGTFQLGINTDWSEPYIGTW